MYQLSLLVISAPIVKIRTSIQSLKKILIFFFHIIETAYFLPTIYSSPLSSITVSNN